MSSSIRVKPERVEFISTPPLRLEGEGGAVAARWAARA